MNNTASQSEEAKAARFTHLFARRSRIYDTAPRQAFEDAEVGKFLGLKGNVKFAET